MKRHEGEGREGQAGEVVGDVRGAFRSVLLGWTDPVSGERLTVRMRGEGDLLASLASLGFELLAGESPDEEPPRGGRVLSFRAQRTRRVRSLRAAGVAEPAGEAPKGSAAAG